MSSPSGSLEPVETSDDISDVGWAEAPVLIIFWVLMVIVMLQFFTRYVLNDSLGWTEEIARYLLILLTFVGSITCVKQGGHIFLEFFFRYVPEFVIKPMAVLVELINTVFFGFAGYFGVELALETAHQNMVSVPLPKGIIYWAVVACCLLMSLLSLIKAYKRLNSSSAAIADDIQKQSTSV